MLRINKNISVKQGEFDPDKIYMPEPGMLGTEYVGSDSYVVICVSVDSPKRISLVRWWGVDSEEDVKYDPNVNIDEEGVMWYIGKIDPNKSSFSKIEKWSLRKGDRWVPMGNDRGRVHWGIGVPYRDPSF